MVTSEAHPSRNTGSLLWLAAGFVLGAGCVSLGVYLALGL